MTNWTTRTGEVMTWNALLLASLSLACGSTDTGDPRGANTAQGQHSGSMEAGAHGGRLLRSGSFELEFAIFERGVPPEFRAWVHKTLIGPTTSKLNNQNQGKPSELHKRRTPQSLGYAFPEGPN